MNAMSIEQEIEQIEATYQRTMHEPGAFKDCGNDNYLDREQFKKKRDELVSVLSAVISANEAPGKTPEEEKFKTPEDSGATNAPSHTETRTEDQTGDEFAWDSDMLSELDRATAEYYQQKRDSESAISGPSAAPVVTVTKMRPRSFFGESHSK